MSVVTGVLRVLTLLPPCEKFDMLNSAMAGSPSLGVLGAVAGECFMLSRVSPLTPLSPVGGGPPPMGPSTPPGRLLGTAAFIM